MNEEDKLVEVQPELLAEGLIPIVAWKTVPVEEKMDPTPPEELVPPVEAKVVPLEEEFKNVDPAEAVPPVKTWTTEESSE